MLRTMFLKPKSWNRQKLQRLWLKWVRNAISRWTLKDKSEMDIWVLSSRSRICLFKKENWNHSTKTQDPLMRIMRHQVTKVRNLFLSSWQKKKMPITGNHLSKVSLKEQTNLTTEHSVLNKRMICLKRNNQIKMNPKTNLKRRPNLLHSLT